MCRSDRAAGRAAVLAAAVLLLAASGPAEEIREPDLLAAWTSFGEGAWVRWERTDRRDGKVAGSEVVRRLVRLDDRTAVFETRTRDGEGEPGVTEQTIERTPAPVLDWKETGTEELEVAGEKHRCRVVEAALKDPEGRERRWVARIGERDETLRRDTTWRGDDGEHRSVQNVVAFADPVRVAGRTLSCTVHEVETTGPGTRARTKAWTSPDLPGGVARTETTIALDGGVTIETKTETVDWGVRKSD